MRVTTAKLIKRFLGFLMGNNCTYRVPRLLTIYPLAHNRPAANNFILVMKIGT
jgi:hypothetical protein